MSAVKDSNFETFKLHFPQQISKGIVDYSTNEALLFSRYIFVNNVKGLQFGYCTHCQNQYLTDEKLKHGAETSCKRCQSKCVVKDSYRSRNYMVDEAFFIYYDKSVINPQSIIARGILVRRDYSGDYTKVKTQYDCSYMYLFEEGNAELYERYWENWRKRKSIISQFHTSMIYKKCSVSIDSIKKAVKGSYFQYSTWEKYLKRDFTHDMLDFFDLASKYPCIEYLTKMGFKELVLTKLRGLQMNRVINWRGKTIFKVLRLTKAEIKEICRLKIKANVNLLHYYHLSKKNGSYLTIAQAAALHDIGGSELEELLQMKEIGTLNDIHRYFLKQLARADKHYTSANSTYRAWRDYIRECRMLGMDLKSTSVIFPNNLYTAHQKTTEKIKYKEDEALNQKIAERLKTLKDYCYEEYGLIIRPALSSKELFEEAAALSHCVGGYVKEYAEGITDIYVIRKAEDLNKPFYTMEILKGEITQVYGYKNAHPTNEIIVLIESFKLNKLTKVKENKKSRKQIAQPA